ARAGEPDVRELVAPDHRVVEVAVPEVLELVVRVGLGCVVPGTGAGEQGTVVELQRHVALHVHGTVDVTGPLREVHGAAAARVDLRDRFVDRGRGVAAAAGHRHGHLGA